MKLIILMLNELRKLQHLEMIFWPSVLGFLWKAIPISSPMKRRFLIAQKRVLGMPCAMGGWSQGDDFWAFTFSFPLGGEDSE
jgi:hypothetical protein